MKKVILVFGLISGVFSSAMMVGTMRFADAIGQDRGYVVGYAVLVLSFLLVYFGIRSYRENSGGEITFAKGFAVGICITLISCAFYVVTWEILYFNFMPDFLDKYSAHQIDKLRAAGAGAAQIQAQIEQAGKLKESYNNPLYNSALTFLEPFPVGLLITLLSAAILRKRPKTRAAQSPMPVAN